MIDSPPESLHAWARPYSGGLCLTALLLALTGVFELGLPLFTGHLIDAAVRKVPMSNIDKSIIGFVSVAVTMLFLGQAHKLLCSKLDARMMHDLQLRVFGHILKLGSSVFQTFSIGELRSRIEGDLEVLRYYLIDGIPNALRYGLQLVAICVLLFQVNGKLAVITLLVIPPIALAVVFFSVRLQRLSRSKQDAIANAGAVADEILNALRTVEVEQTHAHEEARYKGALRKLVGIRQSNEMVWGWFSHLTILATSLGTLVVLWSGANLLLQDHLSAGGLAACVLYAGFLYHGVRNLGLICCRYQAAAGAMSRVFELLSIRSEVEPPAAPVSLSRRASAEVSFSQVSFSYPSRPKSKVLDQISFSVKRGECIAVIGPSGAGKSTLCSLLLRLYPPTSGVVSFSGVDVRNLNPTELRNHIAVVPQEPFIFTGSIRENISYGNFSCSPREIEGAAATAGAHEFIMELPKGYEEQVGLRGLRLSVGQKQRIVIARALLKKSPVLLMDEPTSALDSDSEELIRRMMRRRGDQTIVVIAHQLATIKEADRILLMSNGRIVADGTHYDLCRNISTYARSWHFQTDARPTATAKL